MGVLLRLVELLVSAIANAGRLLSGGDAGAIRREVAAGGGRVVWIRKLDRQPERPADLAGPTPVAYYEALVERDGARKVEAWRAGSDGAWRN